MWPVLHRCEQPSKGQPKCLVPTGTCPAAPGARAATASSRSDAQLGEHRLPLFARHRWVSMHLSNSRSLASISLFLL